MFKKSLFHKNNVQWLAKSKKNMNAITSEFSLIDKSTFNNMYNKFFLKKNI